MPPLADAVRLVDGEQRDLRQAGQEIEKARAEQALRRHVQQVQLAATRHTRDLAGVVRRGGGVEAGGGDAGFLQRRHLVLHQRDQRRHHQRHAVAQQGRDLVAQAFAAAGGHQHQRVAAVGDMLDDVALHAAERRVAESVLKYRERVLHR